jgi:hypothetical protein
MTPNPAEDDDRRSKAHEAFIDDSAQAYENVLKLGLSENCLNLESLRDALKSRRPLEIQINDVGGGFQYKKALEKIDNSRSNHRLSERHEGEFNGRLLGKLECIIRWWEGVAEDYECVEARKQMLADTGKLREYLTELSGFPVRKLFAALALVADDTNEYMARLKKDVTSPESEWATMQAKCFGSILQQVVGEVEGVQSLAKIRALPRPQIAAKAASGEKVQIAPLLGQSPPGENLVRAGQIFFGRLTCRLWPHLCGPQGLYQGNKAGDLSATDVAIEAGLCILTKLFSPDPVWHPVAACVGQIIGDVGLDYVCGGDLLGYYSKSVRTISRYPPGTAAESR